MKLIVGLGNPEKKYENTRHNCGFRAIDYYAKKNNLSFKSKFKGLYCEQVVNNEKMILLKPQTYMNLSGESVREIVNFYNIDIEDILIIYDDIDYFSSKKNIITNSKLSIQNCTMSNYIELDIPDKKPIKKGQEVIIVFIGGDINNIRIIGGY